MQETRRKYPDRGRSAQRTAIALRDVLALLIVNEYETFGEALLDIASLPNLQMETMPLLRSQVLISKTSMAGMAQRTTDIADEVHNCFKVPLSDDEIADIHSAYRDCAIRAASKTKRKPHRPAKHVKKKIELNGSSNAIEIIYHDQLNGAQLVADPRRHHEVHDEPEVWTI